MNVFSSGFSGSLVSGFRETLAGLAGVVDSCLAGLVDFAVVLGSSFGFVSFSGLAVSFGGVF